MTLSLLKVYALMLFIFCAPLFAKMQSTAVPIPAAELTPTQTVLSETPSEKSVYSEKFRFVAKVVPTLVQDHYLPAPSNSLSIRNCWRLNPSSTILPVSQQILCPLLPHPITSRPFIPATTFTRPQKISRFLRVTCPYGSEAFKQGESFDMERTHSIYGGSGVTTP